MRLAVIRHTDTACEHYDGTNGGDTEQLSNRCKYRHHFALSLSAAGSGPRSGCPSTCTARLFAARSTDLIVSVIVLLTHSSGVPASAFAPSRTNWYRPPLCFVNTAYMSTL